MTLLSGGLGKAFATVLALIWLFTGVYPLMRSKVTGLSKRLGAKLALKWLLSVVNSHVDLKENATGYLNAYIQYVYDRAQNT